MSNKDLHGVFSTNSYGNRDSRLDDKANCRHINSSTTTATGGRLLRICNDCGEYLSQLN